MPPSDDARDLYSSIQLRRSLPVTFAKDRESALAKFTAAIGEACNNVGGLFGKANFYGETVVPPDQDKSAIDQAKDCMFLDTSYGMYLTNIGRDVGVPRPPQAPFDDDLYRHVVEVLAWLPKTILHTAIRLAEAVFGTREELENSGLRAWQFYEVNPNEIIFECPQELITGTPETASYMHGVPGVLTATLAPSANVTFSGQDVRSASSSSLVGRTIYVFHTGVWNTYTILASSYSGQNQLTLSSTVPAGGGFRFYIDIPATDSFAGDFMLADATIPAGGTNPPSAVLVYLYGRGLLDLFVFYMDFLRASGVVLRVETI